MTLCNLIPLWFYSYVNSNFLCTLMNVKTSVVCKMAKNMFGNCWECLSAGKRLIICIMWCVCVCVVYYFILFHLFQLQAIHRKEATGIEEK